MARHYNAQKWKRACTSAAAEALHHPASFQHSPAVKVMPVAADSEGALPVATADMGSRMAPGTAAAAAAAAAAPAVGPPASSVASADAGKKVQDSNLSQLGAQ